jgi:hypothetical protein
MSARPLFPATASPAALEALAAHAFEGPTYREDREEAAAEYRAGRCADLCAESFDSVDLDAELWMADDEEGDVLAVACAAIRGNDDDLRAAITRLRDRYLEARAESYAQKVRDEEARDAEDAWEAA